jgi:hypothetical protein
MAASTLVHTPRHAAREGYDLRLRTRVLIHRSALDHALADGADPSGSPELALRAKQIVSPKCRELLADSVERVITAATRPLTRVSAAAPLRREEILDARPLLLTLAADLRAPGPVRAQGVALTRSMLIDVSSALYEPSETGALSDAVEDARRGLLPPEVERR